MCSASLAKVKTQTKTMMSTHCIQTAYYQKNKKQNKELKMLTRCAKSRILIHCWRVSKLIQSLWTPVWRFFKNLRLELSYDITVLNLGINPNDSIFYNRYA